MVVLAGCLCFSHTTRLFCAAPALQQAGPYPSTLQPPPQPHALVEEPLPIQEFEETACVPTSVGDETGNVRRPASREKRCGAALMKIRDLQRVPGPIVNPLASQSTFRTAGRQAELQTLLCRRVEVTVSEGSEGLGKVVSTLTGSTVVVDFFVVDVLVVRLLISQALVSCPRRARRPFGPPQSMG